MTEITHTVALPSKGQIVLRTISEKYPDWRPIQGVFVPADPTTSEFQVGAGARSLQRSGACLSTLVIDSGR